jgi:hypothetical protein
MQPVAYSSWLLPGLGGCDGFFISGIAQLRRTTRVTGSCLRRQLEGGPRRGGPSVILDQLQRFLSKSSATSGN